MFTNGSGPGCQSANASSTAATVSCSSNFPATITCVRFAPKLETTDGLPVSMKLYQHLGFETVSCEAAELWNGPRTLIVMEKTLSD